VPAEHLRQMELYWLFSVLFLDEKHQKSRAAEKKAKNFLPG
jgi:hypothetical protein